MTPEQIEILNLELSNQFRELTDLGIPCYKVKNKNIWISQYDFAGQTDLIERNMYCIYGYKYLQNRKINSFSYVSKEMFEEGRELQIQKEIENLL